MRSIDKNAQKLEHSYASDENENDAAALENSLQFLKKLKHVTQQFYS